MSTWMSGDSDWIKSEREHEHKMKQLELEERKRDDSYRQWRSEQRAIKLAFVGITLAIAGVIGYAMFLWAQHSGERTRLDNEQRLACIEQGGTPTQVDGMNSESWMCLYLQREAG